MSATDYTYDGTEKKPSITVTLNGKALVKDIDYTIAYENNKNIGTAKVTVVGKENYTGTIEKTFTITAASIKDAKVSLAKTSYSYDGKTKKTAITVTLNGKKLVNKTDYTVSYKNNINIGKATVTIAGKGNYTGTFTKTFTIKEKKGTAFTSGKYKYKVTGSSTAAFNGIASTKITKVTIPKTVKYGGKTFKVTSIADGALKKKTKVTQITIGTNVKTIGTSAFEGCKNLKTIKITSTNLKTVGKEAFKGINAKAAIKVPKSKLKSYQKLLKGKGQGSKVKIVKY